MSDLGIFIDESGDVGSNSEFYLIALVFHNQGLPVDNQVAKLSEQLVFLGLASDAAIHSGPIVRKEEDWHAVDLADRRKAFSAMFRFIQHCSVSYKTLVVRKSECADRFALRGRLANEMGMFLRDNLAFFQGFDKVIVYYDNGQALVTDLINTVLSAYLSKVDVRKIVPRDYRLSQAADMLCTLELMGQKGGRSGLSRSEELFFGSRRALVKNFLKPMRRLSFKEL